MAISALILAKSDSKRLPNKNTLLVHGRPMFVRNLHKCKKIFGKVYVSSDSMDILKIALENGGDPILRGQELCGDVPNIPVYKHALKYIDEDIVVAVQANSPTIDENLIRMARKIMSLGCNELMTCHPNYSLYGSIWGFTRERIKNYIDPYRPTPEVLIVDNSIDVHTEKDYNEVNKFYENE